MKKIFKIIGISCLTCFSFYWTNKVVDLSKEKDPIMQEIIDYKEEHNVLAVDATIDGNYISSGNLGKVVDVDESYKKMKMLGKFDESLLVFIEEEPALGLKDNLDKYVIGSRTDEYLVSIVFVLNDNNNLDEILSILNNNDIKSTFFVDSKFLSNDDLKKITNFGHNLGILSYGNKYDFNSVRYTSNVINSFGNSNVYCYSSIENDELLDSCARLKSNTILSEKIENKLYSSIKNDLNKGSIYSVSNSDSNLNVLDLSIKYIKQKGYSIIDVSSLLDS